MGLARAAQSEQRSVQRARPSALTEQAPDQIPDVFVYLYKGVGAGRTNYAFCRFNSRDLMAEKFGGRCGQ